MRRLAVKGFLTAALAALALSGAFAADIVTLPTANQMKANQLEAAYYRIFLDYPGAGAPTNMNLMTAYWGITDRLEVDGWLVDPNKGDTEVVINPSFLLFKETSKSPNVVIGAQDLTNSLGNKTSVYAAAAKNVVMDPTRKLFPVVRLHLGVGTNANKGLFGGVQTVVHGQIGAILLYSQNDVLLGGRHIIAGLTYTFPKVPLVVKGGVLGRHTWVGIAYTFPLGGAAGE